MSVQRLPSSYKIFHGQRSGASVSPLSTHSLFPSRNGARIIYTSPFPFFRTRRESFVARIRRESRKLAKNGFVVRATSDSSISSPKLLPASDVSISDILWPSAGILSLFFFPSCICYCNEKNLELRCAMKNYQTICFA